MLSNFHAIPWCYLCGRYFFVLDRTKPWTMSSAELPDEKAHLMGITMTSLLVASVTDTGGIFSNAYSFNQVLAIWDTSRVTLRNALFAYAHDRDGYVWSSSQEKSGRWRLGPIEFMTVSLLNPSVAAS